MKSAGTVPRDTAPAGGIIRRKGPIRVILGEFRA